VRSWFTCGLPFWSSQVNKTSRKLRRSNPLNFDGHVTVHLDNILIIEPTRCTNSSKFSYFGMKLYMFRTVPLSVIRSFSLYTQQWYMSYRFAGSLRAGSGWNIPILLASCQQTCMTYTTAVCTAKTPDRQRNCPKHVELQSKNKFGKLVHLVGFTIKKFNTMQSHERQIL
jgi:hypothetical protein